MVSWSEWTPDVSQIQTWSSNFYVKLSGLDSFLSQILHSYWFQLFWFQFYWSEHTELLVYSQSSSFRSLSHLLPVLLISLLSVTNFSSSPSLSSFFESTQEMFLPANQRPSCRVTVVFCPIKVK